MNMKQLLKALEIRKKYNAMPFDEFIAEYENYFNVKVPKEVKEKFQNIGLNNVDFITSEYLKYYIPSKEE